MWERRPLYQMVLRGCNGRDDVMEVGNTMCPIIARCEATAIGTDGRSEGLITEEPERLARKCFGAVGKQEIALRNEIEPFDAFASANDWRPKRHGFKHFEPGAASIQ